MQPSTTLVWFLVALASAAATYHLGHAIGGRGRRRPGLDVDLTHAVMGAAMAVMLVGGLDRPAARSLVGVFAAGTLWFAVRAIATYIDAGAGAAGERTRQSLCCVAMTGMLAITVAARASSALAGGAAEMSAMSDGPGLPAAYRAGPLGSHLLLIALLLVQGLVVGWTAGGLRPPAAVAMRAHRASQLATAVGGACMLARML